MNKVKKRLKQGQKGLIQAVLGIITGIILTSVINALARDGHVPVYFVWTYGLIGITGNIITLKTFQKVGILYSAGWLIGSWFFKDILSPVNFAFNIIAPIVIILLRVWFGIRKVGKGLGL